MIQLRSEKEYDKGSFERRIAAPNAGQESGSKTVAETSANMMREHTNATA